MDENILKIFMDDDSRPVKEPMLLSEMHKSLFKDQYGLALKQIEIYLSGLSKVDGKDDLDLDSINNIFAFIGDRGSGKTSCMVSLGDFLTKNETYGKAMLPNKDFPFLHGTQFFKLDLIDPTYFDANNDFLSLFLAKLYSSFRKKNKEFHEERDENKKMKFLKQISLTYEHLKSMTKTKKSEDDVNIESLISLSSAVDLKNDIREVVDAYIDYFNLKDHMLLLRIDDLDLNANQAVEMLEYIRKYFVQPNILILMALKLDQMKIVLDSKYKEFYSTAISDENGETRKMMVERYLSKLIPQSQRIYMPNPEDYLGKELWVYNHREDSLGPGELKNVIKFTSLKQAIPELIFKKTRYLFYNSVYKSSWIVPRNFREIRFLLKLLWSMKDFTETQNDNTGKNVVHNYYNQDIFKEYFFDNWVAVNLTTDKQKIVKDLLQFEDSNYLNKFIIEVLTQIYYDKDSILYVNTKIDHSDEISEILLRKNYFYKISVADVLYIIDDLSDRYIDDENQKFFFFLRSYYSMKLYEAYDRVTEEAGSKNGKYIPAKNEIFKSDIYAELNDYEKITAGFLFKNYNNQFFSEEFTKKYSYINTNEFVKLMFDINRHGELIVSANCMLLELIMLCTRFDESLPKIMESPKNIRTAYRADSRLDFVDSITKEAFVFDPMSIFFNLPRIKECYNRFGSLSYNDKNVGKIFMKFIASEHPFKSYTLFGKFREWIFDNKCLNIDTSKNFKQIQNQDDLALQNAMIYNKWKSCCSFRNVEIMQDFQSQIIKKINSFDGNIVEGLIKFFEAVSEYSIKTYDRESGGDPYIITFEFFKIISDYLKKMDERMKKQFEKLFIAIDSSSEDRNSNQVIID